MISLLAEVGSMRMGYARSQSQAVWQEWDHPGPSRSADALGPALTRSGLLLRERVCIRQLEDDPALGRKRAG
ncbi:MAG: hypothetical protein J0L73_21550 [Verrucomicrobia bacterium]|nr:hypothetical protein [Verrucomicrobiota bacterium]